MYVQTWLEKFLECFWSQKSSILSKRMTMKKERDFENALGQIIDILSNGHGRTRGFYALDNSCNFLLRWRRQIKRNIRFLWLGHPRKNCKHFHAIYTFQCVHKVGSTLNGVERRKQWDRIWKLFWRSPKSFYLFHHCCQ